MSSSTTSSSSPRFQFGPFDVSTQVFYATPLSFALVNLKPLLPGHVLVCPRRVCPRVTALAADELADLFLAVQRVQGMLAVHYFREADSGAAAGSSLPDSGAGVVGASGTSSPGGSFNLAIQDGPDAGQTVPHVHVHVLPRIRGATAKDASTDGDALYDALASEPGNVGGQLWDAQHHAVQDNGPRPVAGGRFPPIEDSLRQARSMAEMEAEAGVFRGVLRAMGIADGLE